MFLSLIHNCFYCYPNKKNGTLQKSTNALQYKNVRPYRPNMGNANVYHSTQRSKNGAHSSFQSQLQIIRLESERTQWEQRYLEESAMRQVAIDAASIPKDAKIAALEKNSAESEKMIAEARSEKIKQLEEMQGTQVCWYTFLWKAKIC